MKSKQSVSDIETKVLFLLKEFMSGEDDIIYVEDEKKGNPFLFFEDLPIFIDFLKKFGHEFDYAIIEKHKDFLFINECRYFIKPLFGAYDEKGKIYTYDGEKKLSGFNDSGLENEYRN